MEAKDIEVTCSGNCEQHGEDWYPSYGDIAFDEAVFSYMFRYACITAGIVAASAAAIVIALIAMR